MKFYYNYASPYISLSFKKIINYDVLTLLMKLLNKISLLSLIMNNRY